MFLYYVDRSLLTFIQGLEPILNDTFSRVGTKFSSYYTEDFIDFIGVWTSPLWGWHNISIAWKTWVL